MGSSLSVSAEPTNTNRFSGNNKSNKNNTTTPSPDYYKSKYRSFPGSAVLEKTFCGSIDTTDPSEYDDVGTVSRLLKRAEALCISSPVQGGDETRKKTFAPDDDDDYNDDDEENSIASGRNKNNNRHRRTGTAGQLLARALVSEVTDNPQTMTADRLQERERQLLRAQHAATVDVNRKAIGREAPPHVLKSLSRACTGEDDVVPEMCHAQHSPSIRGGGGGAQDADYDSNDIHASPFQVTIGLCLSRRSAMGHPWTVTRQTAYDFNDLQDRGGKYVSSCAGWNAGGGEPGGSSTNNVSGDHGETTNNTAAAAAAAKVDNVHIPIIHIDCLNQPTVDAVIGALASGELFIPHMSILPEALSSETTSQGTTNITVRFGCERRDESPPEEWPNWQLEFMHNQLYEYFYNTGARWMKRPFQVVLAESVRWKTVKHMNRYFAQGEAVVDNWRNRGPQYLDPVPAHLEQNCGSGSIGASSDECLRPHGIYLFQRNNGSAVAAPTNYFAPNFEPPYTTKMTRNLLLDVLCKSWDANNREWSSAPVPHIVSPTALIAAACGCSDRGGFVAKEVTTAAKHWTAATTNDPQRQPSVTAPPTTASLSSRQQLQQRSSPHIRHRRTAVAAATTTTPKSLDAAGGSVMEHSTMEFPSGNSVKTAPATFGIAAEESSLFSSLEQQQQHHQTVLLPKDSDATAGSGSQKENVDDSPHVTKAKDAVGGASTGASQRQRYATAEEDLLKFTQKKGFRLSSGGGGLADANSMVSGDSKSQRRASVAGTETTVLHANKDVSSFNKGSNINRPNGGVRSPIHRGKMFYSDEDFMAELSDTETDPRPTTYDENIKDEKSLQQRRQNGVNQVVGMSRSSSDSHSPTKMIAQSTSSSSGLFSGGKMMRANYSHHHQGGNGNSSPRNNGVMKSVRRSESLDYSTDGSSAYFRTNDSTSLLGQDFTSVAPTSLPVVKTRPSSLQEVETEEESLLSIQESSSSMQSVVPADEELYAVGWAKALDSNSGNYYYFTLDRTKTVWENPLSQSQ